MLVPLVIVQEINNNGTVHYNDEIESKKSQSTIYLVFQIVLQKKMQEL